MSSDQKLEIKITKFIKAPIERVWQTLIDQDKFFRQFIGDYQGEVKDGAILLFPNDPHPISVLVTEAVPPRRLAFRWHHTAQEHDQPFKVEESTLVEVDLYEEGEGTRLEFSETEFENVPADRRQFAFDSVNSGWPGIIDTFGDKVERGGDAWLSVVVFGTYKESAEELWAVIGNPVRLFSESTNFSGVLMTGQVVMVEFGTRYKFPILIEEYVENSSLSFRWHHDDRPADAPFDPAETTLVTLMICPADEGNYLVLSESEFDRLPEAMRQDAFQNQTKGWALLNDHVRKVLGA